MLGGIGYAYVDVDAVGFSDSDNLLCGQLGAGLGYSPLDHLVIDLKYKYLLAEKAHVDVLRAEISAHQVLLGLRYEFQ